MNYEGVLKFKGVFRNYQARVLENAARYLGDGKIHIVAAPGSGKTTLGIELIRKLNRMALVLVPTVAIREQWIARMKAAFLCDGVDAEVILSQSLQHPKAITVVTYQMLHSAITKSRDDEEDYEEFLADNLIGQYDGGILCLDECHHLKSEWWKTLEEFKNKLTDVITISLTATPPYDSTPAMWKRYMDMCGEIDVEITIPELVKDGSICPHQDYIYFNYPTEEEQLIVQAYEEKSRMFVKSLFENTDFLMEISRHAWLNEQIGEHKSDLAWMERLLQEMIFDNEDGFLCSLEYAQKLKEQLQQNGLIEKKKVCLQSTDAIEKNLTNSIGKIKSIREIVDLERKTLGTNLRMLILTDYIRKEYENAIGNESAEANSLGVLPLFEILRRDNLDNCYGLSFGVLCGSVVVIPAQAMDAFQDAVDGKCNIVFEKVGMLATTQYVKISAASDSSVFIDAVTDIFEKGYIHVLIGTKSLLGEGWDSPCINSLILASTVGSFVLSNQMRGRAIRIYDKAPDKTSNIWHLVCVRPKSEGLHGGGGIQSEDYDLLERRMEHFLGLHYTKNVIETGMERLCITGKSFSKSDVDAINAKMREISANRSTLLERWNCALNKGQSHQCTEVVTHTTVKDCVVPTLAFHDAIAQMVVSGAVMFFSWYFGTKIGKWYGDSSVSVVGTLIMIAALFYFTSRFPKLFMVGTPYERLKSFGKGVRKALIETGMLENTDCKVVSITSSPHKHSVYLEGGSKRDQELFAKCIQDFFGVIDNQRYILVKKHGKKGFDRFFAVPERFALKKEMAEQFTKCMEPYVGEYECVYTRSDYGRKLLEEARVYALVNLEERCQVKKKMK